MRRVTRLWVLACVSSSSVALVAVTPAPGPGDPRIKVVHYDPDEVISLRAALGYQITIEFGEGERIENVSIGDGLGWQVTPNHKASLLFLKPLKRSSDTNMTVISNLRRYAFDLSVKPPPRRGDPSVVFGLRFDYPAPVLLTAESPPASKPTPPRDLNHAYSFDGSRKLLPTRVIDDGHSTYFTFAENVDFPAIFTVEADRKEALANVSNRDGYVIVDQVARGFVLRRGTEVTTLFNDGFREPQPGPLSPRPRKRPRRLSP